MEDFNATIKVINYDCESGYAIVDGDNTIPCDKVVTYKGRDIIHLPSNSKLRQWADRKKTDAAIAENGYHELAYKARVTQGHSTAAPRIPGIQYLSEEEQNELNTLIANARERMQADKKKPMTELEKLQAKLAKVQAQIDALATANDMPTDAE